MGSKMTSSFFDCNPGGVLKFHEKSWLLMTFFFDRKSKHFGPFFFSIKIIIQQLIWRKYQKYNWSQEAKAFALISERMIDVWILTQCRRGEYLRLLSVDIKSLTFELRLNIAVVEESSLVWMRLPLVVLSTSF